MRMRYKALIVALLFSIAIAAAYHYGVKSTRKNVEQFSEPSSDQRSRQ
jgi:hypothetical protein